MPGEPWRNDRRLKIKSINISQMEEVEMTYHRCTQVAQPRGNTPERCHRVHRPKRQRGHIKSAPINVSRMETSQNAYLQHVNALPPNRWPKKDKRRLDELTFKSRMPGEPRCNDGEYGWSPARLAISASIVLARRNLPNQVMTRMSRKVSQTFTTSLKFYSNRTHSFATTYYWT